MSDFFQLFNPGLRHLREQQDLEKILVVDDAQGGSGPRPLDLESGSVVLRMPQPRPGGDDADPAGDSDPGVPVPDDKDWTIVLVEGCPECGFDPGSIDVRTLPALVRAATSPWSSVLARPDAARRPRPLVWSALEYGCHVRDVLRLFSRRLALMLTVEDPVFADWDQDAAAIEARYWAQRPDVVAAELAEAAEQNALAWTQVGADDWQRPGLRGNGSRFTVDSLGRYLLHDLRHHLRDVGA